MRVYARFLSIFMFLTLCFGMGVPLQVEAGSNVEKNTPWIDSKENDGIIYFLFSSPSRIERYDLTTEAFLNPITLFDTPTAFTLDSEGLYVCFDNRIDYLTLDGFVGTPLHITSSSVNRLFIFNEFLYLLQDRTLISINKYTGERIDYHESFYELEGISVSTKHQKIFARTKNVTPSDIHQIAIYDDGSFGDQIGSPYHGAYPNARKTYLFPNEEQVVDSSRQHDFIFFFLE